MPLGRKNLRLSAVVLARALAFIEPSDLVKKGGIYFPDLVREVAKYYRFQKSPETFEEHDLTKGVVFLEGRSGKRTISKFAIWPNILVLETRTSTDDSKAILDEFLMWGKEKFNLTYEPGMIRKYGYVSDLTFYSEAPILGASGPLERIAQKTSEALTAIWKEPIRFEPIDLKVGHDPLSRKWQIAPFQITRRAETEFSANKYFSEAPLPTDLHISLLEEYEAGIMELYSMTGKARNI
jgi:hypothetical protein